MTNDPIRQAILVRAAKTVDEVWETLMQVQQYLGNDAELAALGALSGVAERIRYVETLLTVLRDLQPKPTTDC